MRKNEVRERYQNYLCEHISQGMILLQADGRVLYANQAACNLLGLNFDPARYRLSQLGTIEPEGIWKEKVFRKEMLFMRRGRQERLIISTEIKKEYIIVYLEEASAENLRWLQQEPANPVTLSIIHGIGPELRDRALSLSQSNIPALISGESGTGKEVLARAIHLSSNRSQGPFVVVDCSSMPATLIESELFGYEPGSFTGARRDGKPGKFELAHRGTIFLDEVGDMPLDLQSRLLRILNDHRVMRLGGNRARRVDIRILASTNKDLPAMVAAGTFRSDLYYRIMGAEIVLPPLRERMEFFDELMNLFWEKHAPGRRYVMDGAALKSMKTYSWPGNIRELEKCIEYLAALKPGGRIGLADLPERIRQQCPEPKEGTFKEKMECYEHHLLLQALARNEYNITKTAVELGLSRRGLQKKMKKAGIGVFRDQRS